MVEGADGLNVVSCLATYDSIEVTPTVSDAVESLVDAVAVNAADWVVVEDIEEEQDLVEEDFVFVAAVDETPK